MFRSIAKRCKTDKDQYAKIYEKLFSHKREEPIRLMEIGVLYGNSIKLWENYFPNARNIVGLDVFAPSRYIRKYLTFPTEVDTPLKQSFHYFNKIRKRFMNDRVQLFKANQSQREGYDDLHNSGYRELAPKLGMFDIIIDDGSHTQNANHVALACYQRHLSENGIYIVEDISCNRNKNAIPNEQTFQQFFETGQFKSEFLTDQECRDIEEKFDNRTGLIYNHKMVVLHPKSRSS